jgi:alpha-D-ribose 1-methylphosphonate 5-triphosphate synthase subunit PhnG
VAGNIPPPNTALVDQRGNITPEWYRWLARKEANIGSGEVATSGGLTGGGFVSNGVEISIADRGVTDAKIRNGAACSVIGRFQNSTGPVTDIKAMANGRILMREDDVLVFKQLSATLAGAQPDDTTLTGLTGLPSTLGLVEQTATDVFGIRLIGVANASDVLTRAGGDGRYASLGSGVLSFNTRTGAVTLTSADVTTALTYTPTSVTGLTGTQSVAAFKAGLSLVKGDVGLGSVDNTSDATKNAAAVTLTNKTIALGSNTVSGTKAEFDAAVTDGNIVYTDTLDTDTTLAANSDAKLATQKAVKAYVDQSVAGLLDLKGSQDCSASPNYPAASKGDAYYVSVAGKIGGASGKSVDIGDVVVASADNAGGTEASVGTSWFVLEHNLTGALLAANNLSDLTSAATARTNLGLGNVDNTADVPRRRASQSAATKLSWRNDRSAAALRQMIASHPV